MGNGGGDSSLGRSMTVVSSLISVTEMTGVVGVDMVVVFVSSSKNVIKKLICFTWIVKRDADVGDSTYGEGEWYLILLLSPSVVSVISKRFLLLPCCRPIIVLLYHPRILLLNNSYQIL